MSLTKMQKSFLAPRLLLCNLIVTFDLSLEVENTLLHPYSCVSVHSVFCPVLYSTLSATHKITVVSGPVCVCLSI